MPIVKIRDNSLINKKDFQEITELTYKIADKTLGELEKEDIFIFPNQLKEPENLESEQIILKGINQSYQTSNVVGFLGLKDERLVIQSRFSKSDQDYFFQYLLERVLDIPNILSLNTDANRQESAHFLLLFLFPYFLKSALRKGIFKTYIYNQYNNQNVKGKINIQQHIRQNVPFTGKIAYSQREFSFDNDVMRLIRHTINFIKKKPFGNRLLSKVKDEVNMVINTTKQYNYRDLRNILISNKKYPIHHPYYSEYRLLQQLCILILEYETHQIGLGQQKVYGVLFDCAWLWEEYLNLLISKWFYHPQNRVKKYPQHLFTTENGSEIGRVYPDFISREQHNCIIADAKYKPEKNIKDKDYLQILAYMFRFNAKKGFCLHPNVEETPPSLLFMNQGYKFDTENNLQPNKDIVLTKLGITIPQKAISYENFVKTMRENEKNFLKYLLQK